MHTTPYGVEWNMTLKYMHVISVPVNYKHFMHHFFFLILFFSLSFYSIPVSSFCLVEANLVDNTVESQF